MIKLLANEVWKSIQGYEGYYEVSNLGRIKSLARPVYKRDGTFHRYKNETIKKPKLSKDGYLNITLCVNCKNRSFGIHRLVAEAFVPKPFTCEELEVNHKDLDRTNNYASNLEWVTHQENVSYSSSQGRYEVHDGVNNGRSVPVKIYDKEGSFVKAFQYLGQCAEWMMQNNFCRGKSIHGVMSGIKKSIDNNKPYFNFIIKLA